MSKRNDKEQKNKNMEDIVCYEVSSSNGKKAKPHVQRNKKQIAFNIIGIFLSVVLILFGTGILGVHAFLNRINYKELEESSKISEVSKIEASNALDGYQQNSVPQPDLHVGDLLNDPMVLNVMLFGADNHSDSEYGRSDSMILLSIDTRHQKLKLISFLRDTYVSIPGYGNNKLGHSFSFGGVNLAVQTIQNNFGIKIDRYAIVDFESFTSIIDTLGGIDIELTDEEIDYINWQCWKNKQVETRHELTDKAGIVHLNGRQALWHARNRDSVDGDFSRTSRQRDVINVIMNRLKSSDLGTILNILYQVGPMITTNLKTSEITELASNVLTYLNYDIESINAPESGSIGSDYIFDDVYDIWGNLINCIIIQDWYDFRRKVAVYLYEDSVVSNSLETVNDEVVSNY